MDVEALARVVVHQSYLLHRDLGPGLLESVYEALLAQKLRSEGFMVERQTPISILYDGIRLDEGFRADLFVEKSLIVELKAVETLHQVYRRQLLTYLKLTKLPLGLLINFGAPTIKEGLSRVVNQHNNIPVNSPSIQA